MDMTAISQLIASIGFPIVMCLLMYKYITEDSKQTREAISRLEKAITSMQQIIEHFLEREDIDNDYR